MRETLKMAGIALCVVVVSALVGTWLVGGNQQPVPQAVGGDTRFPNSDLQAKSIRTGASGTKVTEVLTGTCALSTTELPLEATSTDAFSCTATGAVSGQQCSVILPSNSDSTQVGVGVAYVSATTDALNVGLWNLSGTATSSFPAATSSAQYICLED